MSGRPVLWAAWDAGRGLSVLALSGSDMDSSQGTLVYNFPGSHVFFRSCR
jgi:hypothetical protein